MRVHSSVSLAVTAALIAVLAPITAAHAEDKPACALITAAEVSPILGVPAKAGPAIAPMACSFLATSGPAHFMVMLTPAGGDAFQNLKMMIMSSNMDRTHPPAEQISGVGDQAAFFVLSTGDLYLTVFAKSRMIQLVVQHGSGPTTPARKSAMVDEAKRMIARL